MHILITRPEPDASDMRAQLEALGHDVSVEPLLRIETCPIEASAFEGAKAVIATSRNGLRALAAAGNAATAARNLPIFTVGSGTAELAQSMGFARVIAGAGAARDLVPLVVAEVPQDVGPLVHVAGETVAFDMTAALAKHGIAVRKITAYRAIAATGLSNQTAQGIADSTIDAVILMSPRTAAVFVRLIDSAGLNASVRQLACICLSGEVAAVLRDLDPGRIEVAAKPNSAALLSAVSRLASVSRGV